MLFEKDLVIIYIEDKPLTFARIEEIGPDFKPEWFQVKLLILQLPVKIVTWILNDFYLAGDEFTMDGKKMSVTLAGKPKGCVGCHAASVSGIYDIMTVK